MGVFSKYHRFREAGQEANVYNTERFGTPAKSLFTTSKVFTLHRHIDIVDANENVVYTARTKVFTLHDTTDVTHVSGRHVAQLRRKIFTLHERRFVTMDDGTQFQLSNELFHIIKDITNIEGLGWQLKGNIVGLNFELYDSDGSIIALIGQKMFSIHDKYCIDIYKPEYEEYVVTILVGLQHMIRDREAASSAASSSPSSRS